jgi:DNA-binding transcriptional LysR family regulator
MKGKPMKKNPITIEFLNFIDKLRLTGSISEAAKLSGIAQPSATQKLKQMEKFLGLSVWERRGRWRGRFTKAGERFAEYAQAMLDQTDQLLDEMRTGSPVLNIRVAASTIPGEHLLPPMLNEYEREFPNIKIRVYVTDSKGVIAQIENGLAEIGFSGIMPSAPGIEYAPFAHDEIICAVDPQCKLAGTKQPIDISELAGEVILWREDGSGTRATVEAAMRDKGLTFPENVRMLELGSSHSIAEAVRQGLGIGFLSALAAGTLPRVDVKGLTPIPRTFHILFNESVCRIDHLRSFIEFARSFAAYGP